MTDSEDYARALIYVRWDGKPVLRQGEIVSNIFQVVASLSEPGKSHPKDHPLVIVLSQDCDLTQDHIKFSGSPDAEHHLPNILFCELFDADAIRHQREGVNGTTWQFVRQNKNERYHFLEDVPPSADSLDSGIGETAIDFKRYFTIPTAHVYHQLATTAQRRCRLVSPYLEHLSTRFCYFQFRVALPSDHRSI